MATSADGLGSSHIFGNFRRRRLFQQAESGADHRRAAFACGDARSLTRKTRNITKRRAQYWCHQSGVTRRIFKPVLSSVTPTSTAVYETLLGLMPFPLPLHGSQLEKQQRGPASSGNDDAKDGVSQRIDRRPWFGV